jgi:hypothetical protein
MTVRRSVLFAAVFVAGFSLSYFARKQLPRTPSPEPPTISTIYVRGPADGPGVLHKFSSDAPAKPGDVAAWWVGQDGKTVEAGFVLTAVNPAIVEVPAAR